MSTLLSEIEQTKTLAQKEVEDTIRRTEDMISYYTIRKTTFDPVLVALEAHIQVISVSLCNNSVDISVSGGKDVLNTVFGILRKHKFSPDKRPDKPEPTFSTHFNHDTGARLWLSFSSTLCKRVKVGTKTVEQDIYEVQCE